MNVCVIGTGYVGLVLGACMADLGYYVWCVDQNTIKIEELKKGHVPFYEPGLDALLQKHLASGRLQFTTRLEEGLRHSLFAFIAVGTPQAEDGSANLTYVYDVATEIGQTMDHYLIVITKSTVPVGTGEQVRQIIQTEIDARQVNHPFDVVSNPEFLREGSAVSDFLNGDRIVIGTYTPQAATKMAELYHPLIDKGVPILMMDLASAELTKYGTNGMLATRISFMNELAAICDATGADIDQVKRGIGHDHRIGPHFLHAGLGYGGSCFPKDVRALIETAKKVDVSTSLLKAVDEVNRKQRITFVTKIVEHFGSDLSKYTFGIWGLAFKPNTDDVREAPAIEIIKNLVALGGRIRAHDPVAIINAKYALRSIPQDRITYVDEMYAAIKGTDALLLLTEWDNYRSADLSRINVMLKQPVIFDGRNLFSPTKLKELGYHYYPIGRKASYETT